MAETHESVSPMGTTRVESLPPSQETSDASLVASGSVSTALSNEESLSRHSSTKYFDALSLPASPAASSPSPAMADTRGNRDSAVATSSPQYLQASGPGTSRHHSTGQVTEKSAASDPNTAGFLSQRLVPVVVTTKPGSDSAPSVSDVTSIQTEDTPQLTQAMKDVDLEAEELDKMLDNSEVSDNLIREKSRNVFQSFEHEMEEAGEEGYAICHICEASVPKSSLEDHSISCLIVNHSLLRVTATNGDLKKGLKPILRVMRGKYAADDSDEPDSTEGDRKSASTTQEEEETFSEEAVELLRKLYTSAQTMLQKSQFISAELEILKTHMKKVRNLVPQLEITLQKNTTYLKHCQNIVTLCERKLHLIKSGVSAHAALEIAVAAPAVPQRGREAHAKAAPADKPDGARGRRHLIPGIGDFQLIKAISRGAFGQVFLAKKTNTEDYYAIKVLKKDQVQDKNHIAREQDILSKTHHDYVVKMLYSFESPNNLYFVMEYLNGGDCLALLESVGALNEDMTKQYVAETVLALEHLHSHGIIHRDLKPDNLLIDKDGHLKLTDFGLSRRGADSGNFWGEAKESMQRLRADLSRPSDQPQGEEAAPVKEKPSLKTSNLGGASGGKRLTGKGRRDIRSCVGTPDYVAPEVLLGHEYDTGVDWWALGVITYEFLIGAPPFNELEPSLVFRNILSGHIDWPEPDPEDSDDEDVTEEAQDFIRKLLTLNPRDRLGHGGVDEIKNHPFLADIDFNTIRTDTPVFVPTPENIEDTSYFDCRGDSQTNEAELQALMEEASLAREIEAQPGQALNPFAFKNLAVLSDKNDAAISAVGGSKHRRQMSSKDSVASPSTETGGSSSSHRKQASGSQSSVTPASRRRALLAISEQLHDSSGSIKPRTPPRKVQETPETDALDTLLGQPGDDDGDDDLLVASDASDE